MDFKFDYFVEVLPKVARHLDITLQLTLTAAVFALAIGVLTAIIRYYKIPLLYQLSSAYVFVMRGTPVVVQLYFFYFGLAAISTTVKAMAPVTAVAVVMSLNIGAFMSESIRAALLSVDEGQKEAAYSLGMSNFQLIRRIIIPQALRIALPTLFNDIINLIKMSSLAFMLGILDIMGAAKVEGAQTFRYFEIYAAVMLIYLLVIALFSFIHKYLEKKCAQAY
ncbi:amino acid ABC transporter membrane protein (PAAT family) [Mesocricetibacter intestinalis]|uniref:Amino acid ABC transporter membrane protein (PAAT family) n=1 Tax=Mesocricetibacter intestinalis TaxID=1521930 RepID=A0A4R6VAS5_9PAST|nr:amino acid ABC transporter permease [Mesocricetibacter intestinalis]TDQ57017.1 amino acid ABC transporter membrane protein (PAAT family) [Mesocricetibacter intestinalis]